jgi:histidinol phosphatase-like enzyme
MKTYIIDIDNTICITNKSDYTNSQPIPERIEKINALYNNGNHIIYWTARGSNTGIDWAEFTQNQLHNWNCLYHQFKLGKPSYDIWIDDKAMNSEIFFNET